MPPVTITVAQTVKYVTTKYGFTVTPKTVRHWMRRGLKKDTLSHQIIPSKLPTMARTGIMVTTEKWVDEFFTRTGVADEVAKRAAGST